MRCFIRVATLFSCLGLAHGHRAVGNSLLVPGKAAHRALEFGDFAEDIPEQCPATTTCPVACVANVTDCPTECGPGLTLCVTGNCEVDCAHHDEMYTSPCACSDLVVACPKVVDLYPVCYDRFQPFYTSNTECLEAQVESVPKLSFVGPWFLFFYAAYIAVFIMVVMWCRLNETVFPVPSQSLLVDTPNSNEMWTQTGYRTHWIGTTIYILVELSFLVIQVLLLATTIFYYMQQGAITRWKPVFEDEVQVLQAFQMVWMFGFVWCFWFRYPCTGLYSLFLRRCTLNEATHVAITAPLKRSSRVEGFSPAGHAAALIWSPFDSILRTMFSYQYGRPGLETTFCRVVTNGRSNTRSVQHRMRRFIFDEAEGYVHCRTNETLTLAAMLEQVGGLSSQEAEQRLCRQGENVIPLAKPSAFGSLYKEFNKAFYLYQNFMVWAFANFWFYYMAYVFTIVRLLGAFVVTYFQYTSECTLYKLSQVEGSVEVYRDHEFSEIAAKDLVPGDVVALKSGEVFGDMVILQGSRVLVDESALTGEATPVQKEPIDRSMWNQKYEPSKHRACSLSAGTRIVDIDSDTKVLALVTATGSYTRKGELLTDVLAYERHNFQFDDEVKAVLFILALEAIFMVWLTFRLLDNELVYAWFYASYVLVTVFPPLLPTVFVVSVSVSAKRLQEQRISCPHPEAILLAGKVDYAFFDKTGTMTKQGLDFLSYDDIDTGNRICIGMAVCHLLAPVSTTGRDVMGTEVDVAMFKASGAKFCGSEGEDVQRIEFNCNEYKVLKRFEFNCHSATQSVIVEDADKKRLVFVKGSPESIKRLCLPNSVPDSFDTIVRLSAKAGIYQLAMGYNVLELNVKVADICREDIEGSLSFVGFLNFQNSLRHETTSVLEELDASQTASAMITGDSVYTGIYIARESGMIKPNRTVVLARLAQNDEVEYVDVDCETIVEQPSQASMNMHSNNVDLAMTGQAWNALTRDDPKYIAEIMDRIRVFGRCKPTDKVSIVDAFAAGGYTTLMCGDGQNDCGCLKSAHVGIALSSAEASIVAPFTSLDETLTSVLQVLREGRCALASAFSSYSYYIVYGQTETFLQVITAYFSVTFSEWCWVFLDGIWSITFAFSIPLSKPASRLTRRRPTDSLLGPEMLFSVCGILAINLLFMVIALFALFSQDWFQCRKWNSNDISSAITIGDNFESSVLFIIGGYQFVAAAIVLSFGYTFREAWYKNRVVLFLSVTWTLFIFVMTVYPSSFSCIWRVNCDNEDAVRFVTSRAVSAINNPFNTTVMPVHFRWILVLIMALNLAAMVAWQILFVNGYLLKKIDEWNKSKTACPSLHSNVPESAVASGKRLN